MDTSSGRQRLQPLRSDAEAWALVEENKGLCWTAVNRFVKNQKNLAWYKGDDLRREMESHAWEGFFKACRLWDPKKSKLSTYAIKAMENEMGKALNQLVAFGGNLRSGSSPGPGKYPEVWSADDLAERASEAAGFDGPGESALDQEPGLWDDAIVDWEDEYVDQLYTAQLVAAVRELAQQCPGREGEVVRAFLLADPGYEKDFQSNEYGPGLRFKDVQDQLHMAPETIALLYSQGLEWMRNQLRARGFEPPDGFGAQPEAAPHADVSPLGYLPRKGGRPRPSR